jgi:hypothetical protein
MTATVTPGQERLRPAGPVCDIGGDGHGRSSAKVQATAGKLASLRDERRRHLEPFGLGPRDGGAAARPGQPRALHPGDVVEQARDARAVIGLRPGVDHDQGLPDARGMSVRVEERPRLGAEGTSGEGGGEDFDHQRQCRALGLADRDHGALQRGLGVGRGVAVHVQRPVRRDLAARLSSPP